MSLNENAQFPSQVHLVGRLVGLFSTASVHTYIHMPNVYLIFLYAHMFGLMVHSLVCLSVHFQDTFLLPRFILNILFFHSETFNEVRFFNDFSLQVEFSVSVSRLS